MGFSLEPVNPRDGFEVSRFRYTLGEWERLINALMHWDVDVKLP